MATRRTPRNRALAHGEYVEPGSLFVPTDWIPITVGAAHVPLRALRANGTGTLTVTMPGGSGRVMNFLAGETRYGMFLAVTGSTGTAGTGLEGGV